MALSSASPCDFTNGFTSHCVGLCPGTLVKDPDLRRKLNFTPSAFFHSISTSGAVVLTAELCSRHAYMNDVIHSFCSLTSLRCPHPHCPRFSVFEVLCFDFSDAKATLKHTVGSFLPPFCQLVLVPFWAYGAIPSPLPCPLQGTNLALKTQGCPKSRHCWE